MKRPSQFKLPDAKRPCTEPKQNGPGRHILKIPNRTKLSQHSRLPDANHRKQSEVAPSGLRLNMARPRFPPKASPPAPIQKSSLQPTRRVLLPMSRKPTQRKVAHKITRKPATTPIPSLQPVPPSFSKPTFQGNPSFQNRAQASSFSSNQPRSFPARLPNQPKSFLSRPPKQPSTFSARTPNQPQSFLARPPNQPLSFPSRTPSQSQSFHVGIPNRQSPLRRDAGGARKTMGARKSGGARKSRNPVYMNSKVPTRRRISPNNYHRINQTPLGENIPVRRVNPGYKDITLASLGVPPLQNDEPRCDVCFHVADRNGITDLPWSLECSSCHMRAHPLCYGFAPDSKEYELLNSNEYYRRQWTCEYCRSGAFAQRIPCEICKSTAKGVFKKTEQGGWAHLNCALWIPETYITNAYAMEPIYGIDRIHPQRTKLVCVYCEKSGKHGNMVQCCSMKCATSFHIRCAFKKDPRLLVAVNIYDKNLFPFCMKHHPHRDREREKKEKLQNKERTPAIELTPIKGNVESHPYGIELDTYNVYACVRCSVEFKSDSALRRHMKLCSADGAKSRKINKVVKFHCQIVPESTSTVNDIDEHPHASLQCTICDAKFSKGNACFQAHVKSHQDECLQEQGKQILPYVVMRNSAIDALINEIEEKSRPQRKIKLIIGSRPRKLKLVRRKRKPEEMEQDGCRSQ